MATITTTDLMKIYPGAESPTITGANLEIQDKEFIVLVGPSGCGKSTLLRMIAGLEEISDGELQIDGERMNEQSPKDRDIAMVFQNYALYPHMTVFENMAFGLKLRKVDKQTIKEKVTRAAEILGITHLLDRRPKDMSGGQRQRVAIGRSIVRDPKVFLFDEPLSNLDAKLRVQMRAEIAALQRDLGVTTIYVTHDQVEAMTMGDRVAVLKRGFLQQVDTPQNLYDKPGNVFVAGFIGSPSMNLMKATLGGAGSELAVQIGSNTLGVDPAVAAANPSLASYVGKDIVVGVRPEDLADAELAAEPMPANRKLTTETQLIEALGSEIIVHFPLDAEPFAIMDAEFEGEDAVEQTKDDQGRTIYVGRFSPRSRARMGNPLTIDVDTSRMHFFDPASGDAIRG